MTVRKSARWRYWPFALAGFLALSNCGVFKVVKTGKGAGISDPGGFEQEEPGALPPGWEILGSHTARLELDEEISRSGKPSIRLSSRAGEKVTAIHRVERRYESETMVQIRASLKVSKGVARMWARLLGEDFILAQTPKIPGPRDWQQHTLLLFAPPGAEDLNVLLEMDGPGTLWADALSIENKKLGVGGARPGSFSPMSLPNFDFEDADGRGGIERWSLSKRWFPSKGAGAAVELRADRETFHAGSQSARIRWTVPNDDADGAAFAEYCTPAEPFVNRLVRLSGWLRTDADYGHLQISAYYDTETRESFTSSAPGPDRWGAQVSEDSQSADWTFHEVTALVPPGTRLVCFEFGLHFTSGTIWADDFGVNTRPL